MMFLGNLPKLKIMGTLPLLLALEIHGKRSDRSTQVKCAQIAQGLLAAYVLNPSPGRRCILLGTIFRAMMGNSNPKGKVARWEPLVSVPTFIINMIHFDAFLGGVLNFGGNAKNFGAIALGALGIWSLCARPLSPSSSSPQQQDSKSAEISRNYGDDFVEITYDNGTKKIFKEVFSYTSENGSIHKTYDDGSNRTISLTPQPSPSAPPWHEEPRD